GWRNREGKFMVKQGMVYRSGPFNVSYASSMQKSITSTGLSEASRLGIKTEIDLRTVDNNEVGGLKSVSPLGSGVKYIQAPLDYNYPEKIFTYKNNAESFKKIFKVFADPSSYPIDFHCTAGADRTGCIAFLLNGLMGVSEADLYRDYLFTNFASVGTRTRSSISVAYVKTINNNPGKTLQDKIVSTLTSIGVDINDLNSIYFLLQEEGYRI
ncbi:MAG: tyrosine-protein phosphatase, partial [Mollicutes bacterium]|nr:tyrosine-protein phosphatase [Mollicutes bacterium]